ncbi:MAG TPA: DMT family transporter [Pyrinomonadaceae bacterium]|nr:DMT family transporter [Pyrinomonadaceae bacterium]
MIKIILLTAFALCAFAFNSILCRMALRGGEADSIGFTLVRLIAGAVTLITISYFFGKGTQTAGRGNWISAFFLFAYAICFSLAYLALNAGTGALILFGSVQLTMILFALFRGERPGVLEWLGLATALGGLVYLVLPGLSSPPLYSSALMAVAGAAWGVYTLRGKGGGDPLALTTGNFIWSVPMIAVASIPFFSQIHLSNRGIGLAILSGAVASGIGYTVWYAALRHHTSTRAAILQLAVPVIAAGGGILFLSETVTMRLWIASALILGGIGLTIFGRKV